MTVAGKGAKNAEGNGVPRDGARKAVGGIGDFLKGRVDGRILVTGERSAWTIFLFPLSCGWAHWAFALQRGSQGISRSTFFKGYGTLRNA